MNRERSRFMSAMGYPTATTDEPTTDELEEMLSEGVVMTTDGCYAEPDGECEHRHQSWLLYLGMI